MSNEPKPIGISIAMSRREPFKIQAADDVSSWKYCAFGYFDEIHFDIVENPEDFTLRKLYTDLADCSPEERNRFHSETQKIFLWRDKCCPLVHQKLKDYKDGKGARPFIALFAVKFRRKLTERPGCDICRCIEDYLLKESGYTRNDVDVIAMKSMSIDDIYILVAARTINEILNLLYSLQDFKCEFHNYYCFKKPDAEKPGTDKIDISELAKISAKNLDRIAAEAKIEFNEASSLFDSFSRLANMCKVKIDAAVESGIPLTNKEIKEAVALYDNFNAHKPKLTQKSKFTQKPILTQKTKITQKPKFTQKLLAADCLKALHAIAKLPMILSTHSIIGHNKKIDLNALDDGSPFLVEAEIRLSPGVGLTEFLTKLHDATKDDDDLKNLNLTNATTVSLDVNDMLLAVGNCDFVWRGELTDKQLIKLYSLPMMNEPTHSSGTSLVEFTSLRFLFRQNKLAAPYCTEQSTIDLKIQMREEEMQLAQTWVEEQQKRAYNLFNPISEKYRDEFPYLHNIINDVSFLNVQGCRRFFFALSWSEFETARLFFGKFFKKLESEFVNLEKKSGEEKAAYALMLSESMMLFRDAMAGVFSERMMLDMSMRKNTRTGVYATGAYEVILRRYRDWIKLLRQLMCRFSDLNRNDGEITNPNEKLNFLLVPVIGGPPNSKHLFPLSAKESSLVILRASFGRLIDPEKILPLFVHELGHYLGIACREPRIKAYLLMLANLFSANLTRVLCNLSYIQTPTERLERQRNELASAMFDYFKDKRSKLDAYESIHLDYVSERCINWIGDFIKDLLENPHSVSAINELVGLYDFLNITSLMSKKGILLEMLLSRIVTNDYTNICKDIVRETVADLQMSYILELNEGKCIDTLLTAFISRKRAEPEFYTKEYNNEYNQIIDVTRAVSAIMLIKVRDTDKAFDEIIKEMPEALESRAAILMDYEIERDRAIPQALGNAMRKFNKRNEDEYSPDWDIRLIWRILAPYLYNVGTKIKMYLADAQAKEPLECLRKLYSDIAKIAPDDGMQRLVKLINF